MIEVHNLHKSFGQQKVLDGLDLTVEEGKITSIMGPSGVGKSVLLKLLNGIIQPDQGEIIVEGQDITRLEIAPLNQVRQKFGMLFQDGALFDDMNVFENVSFPLNEHTTLSETQIAKKVEEKLLEVGLANINGKFPNELSGGMRKRVGLARALVLDPKFLFFDEPTTGLDPIITDQIVELILETHKRHGMTIVLISHDLALSYRVAHRVGMLYRGKIVEYSGPEQFRRSNHPFVREFLKAQASHESHT